MVGPCQKGVKPILDRFILPATRAGVLECRPHSRFKEADAGGQVHCCQLL